MSSKTVKLHSQFTTHNPQFATSSLRDRRRLIGITLAFFAGAMLLVFCISIRRKLDVDEHAFIASGALLSRRFVIPYRDYHYNHMPTEVIVYAALFRLGDHLLLIARLFQDACAAGLATAILLTLYFAFKHSPPLPARGQSTGPLASLGLPGEGNTTHARKFRAWSPMALALMMGLLMLTHPLFTRTAGLSWNQDFPMLMAMLAFLAMRHAFQPGVLRTATWVAISGFLLGISVTSRLTFAPAGLGFLVFLLLYPALRPGRRIALLGAFAFGGAIACIPTIWIWAQAPWNAFFGNFLYPHLNTAYHAARDVRHRFTVLPILKYYFLSMWLELPGIGCVAVLFIALLATTLDVRQIRRQAKDCELFALVAIIICLTAGGFMPAPPYPQYFYPPMPFMVLGIGLCLAYGRVRPATDLNVHVGEPASRLDNLVHSVVRFVAEWRLELVLAVCVISALPQYRGIWQLPFISTWTPIRVHAIGVDAASKVRPGKMLTLETTYPLEGGLDVYEVLVTSRFGVRVAPMLSPAERRQYLMPTIDELAGVFQTDPPVGTMTVLGADTALDRAINRDAQAHGYVEVPLVPEGKLWRAPKAIEMTPIKSQSTSRARR